MYNNGKATLAYMCYPYSDNPKRRTKQARLLACKIMKKHPNIFIILPHTSVDVTLFGWFDERKGKHVTQDHIDAEAMEYIILGKIDLFIIGTKKEDMSSGMTWEMAYVEKLNRERRKQVDIKFAKELI